MAVEGSSWHSRLALSALGSAPPALVELKPKANGRFRVGVKAASPCSVSAFEAVDLQAQRVELQVPPRRCPAPDASQAAPRVRVLAGTKLSFQRVVLQPSRPQRVELRLGDLLSLTEPGVDRPAFTPHWDASYLILVQEQTNSPSTGSSPSTSWTWLAARRGDTFIDLSPACRASTPPCGMPDFAVRIAIS